MEISSIGQSRVLLSAAADVGATRERVRVRRLRRLITVLVPLVVWFWMRLLSGHPVSPGP